MREVGPNFVVDDTPYGVLAHLGEAARYFGLPNSLKVQFSYFKHLRSGELRHMISLSRNRVVNSAASPLVLPVPDIVGLCSREQMRRVHAGRSVAPMARDQISKFSNEYLVRHAVGEQGAAVIRYNAVSFGVERPRPYPAIVFANSIRLVKKMALKAAKRLDSPDFLEVVAALPARSWIGFCHVVDNIATRLGGKGFYHD